MYKSDGYPVMVNELWTMNMVEIRYTQFSRADGIVRISGDLYEIARGRCRTALIIIISLVKQNRKTMVLRPERDDRIDNYYK